MLIWVALRVICSIAGYITPEQVHLSWTESPNEMRVTWVTFLPISNYIYYRSILCANSSSWKYIESSYKSFDTAEVFYRVQFIQTGVIPVENDCSYEYYVGSWLGWSKIYQFNGRTPNSGNYDSTNVVVLADWGGGPPGQYTKKLLQKHIKVNKIDNIIHSGDFAYDFQDLEGMVGDAWFNMIQPIAANVPYMSLPGNHELAYNCSHYKARFNMPVNEANQGTGYFYSYDLGRAHYILFFSDLYLKNDLVQEVLTQANWLRDDLEKANKNRENVPWIIMFTHRNLYCSVDWRHPYRDKNSDCGADSVTLRAILEDTIHEAGVDLFLQAHVHLYERFGPIYNNETALSEYDDDHVHINPTATVYITNGNAGNIEGHNDPMSTTPHPSSLYYTQSYGYGRLVVHNKTHLYYEQYSSANLTTIDYVWIIKDKLRY